MQGITNMSNTKLLSTQGAHALNFWGQSTYSKVGSNYYTWINLGEGAVYNGSVGTEKAYTTMKTYVLEKPVKDISMYCLMQIAGGRNNNEFGYVSTFVFHMNDSAGYICQTGPVNYLNTRNQYVAIHPNNYSVAYPTIDITDETIIGDKVCNWIDYPSSTSSQPMCSYFIFNAGNADNELVITSLGCPCDVNGNTGITVGWKLIYC